MVGVPNFNHLDDRLWYYRVIIVRVVDGDTVVALIDKGFGDFRQEYLRLAGIDAPELRPRTGTPAEREQEKAEARVAKQRVVDLCEGRECIIQSHKTGKYGRWLATIFVPPEVVIAESMPTDPMPTVNQVLLDEGHAEPFPRRSRS